MIFLIGLACFYIGALVGTVVMAVFAVGQEADLNEYARGYSEGFSDGFKGIYRD